MSANRISQKPAIWLSSRLSEADAEEFRQGIRGVMQSLDVRRSHLARAFECEDQYIDKLLAPVKPLTRKAARKLYRRLFEILLLSAPVGSSGWPTRWWPKSWRPKKQTRLVARFPFWEFERTQEFTQLKDLGCLVLSQDEHLRNFGRYEYLGDLGQPPRDDDEHYASFLAVKLALTAKLNGLIADSSLQDFVRSTTAVLKCELKVTTVDRPQWRVETALPSGEES